MSGHISQNLDSNLNATVKSDTQPVFVVLESVESAAGQTGKSPNPLAVEAIFVRMAEWMMEQGYEPDELVANVVEIS